MIGSKLNTVYLVGNGFDLSMGLNTLPRVFLQAFVDEYSNGGGHDTLTTNVVAFARDIQDDGVDKWADFEIKIGKYASKFKEDQAENYITRVAALRAFLGEWLQKEQSRADESFIKANSMDCIQSLSGYRSGLRPLKRRKLQKLRDKHSGEHWYQDLICFNYTDVLERMRSAAGGENADIASLEGNTHALIGRFVYAHDSLKDKIVCGVNDISQIDNDAFREDSYVTSNLVKGDMEADVIANDLDMQARAIIEEANVIAVFGMSFGASDRRWWEQIGRKLIENEETILVLFDHEMITAEQKMEQMDLYKRNKAVISTFASAGGIESMSDDVKDRIIVAPSNLLFPIKQPITADAGRR